MSTKTRNFNYLYTKTPEQLLNFEREVLEMSQTLHSCKGGELAGEATQRLHTKIFVVKKLLAPHLEQIQKMSDALKLVWRAAEDDASFGPRDGDLNKRLAAYNTDNAEFDPVQDTRLFIVDTPVGIGPLYTLTKTKPNLEEVRSLFTANRRWINRVLNVTTSAHVSVLAKVFLEQTPDMDGFLLYNDGDQILHCRFDPDLQTVDFTLITANKIIKD